MLFMDCTTCEHIPDRQRPTPIVAFMTLQSFATTFVLTASIGYCSPNENIVRRSRRCCPVASSDAFYENVPEFTIAHGSVHHIVHVAGLDIEHDVGCRGQCAVGCREQCAGNNATFIITLLSSRTCLTRCQSGM